MPTATEQALFAQPMYPEDLAEYGPYGLEESFKNLDTATRPVNVGQFDPLNYNPGFMSERVYPYNWSSPQSQLDLDRARHENMVAAYGTPQIQPFSAQPGTVSSALIEDPYVSQQRVGQLRALEKSDVHEEAYNKMQHLNLVYGTGETMSSLPGTVPSWGDAESLKEKGLFPLKYAAGLFREAQDIVGPSLPDVVRSWGLGREDNIPKVNKALAANEPVGDISDSIRDLVMNQVYEEAKDAGLTPAEAYVLPNVPDDRRDFEGFTNLLLSQNRNLTQEDIDKFASGEGDRTLKSFTEPDYNVQDQMAQWYERAFIDPDEYGWARPTIEQRQEAIRGVQDAPKGFWGALQNRIADLIPAAEASISRDVEFEREQREPTWFPPTTSSGIGGMVEEPATSPFIGDAGFTPSLGGYTIGGPEVGDEEEEVSEERVKVIKKKPKEKRTSVEEQVVVASEVKKALDNASKGKKVKNELKAVVELAKVDPTIVARYTTPGSQALQDITAQVDSFSFMPTIQKKKKTVDPWAFEDRRGGRR